MIALPHFRPAFAGIGLDPDALAYITAVENTGTSVSANQKTAINSFFKQGKTDNWFSLMRRIYLPIWGLAAPNAIDMISNTSGTFNGTVTHSAGFVKGDRSTGFFDLGTRMPTDGLTSDSGLLFCLVKVADTLTTGASMIGQTSSINNQLIRQSTSSNIQARYSNASLSVNGGNARTGILTISSTSNTARSFRRRLSSGVTSIATSSGESAFTLSSVNCFAMARNASGLSEPTNAELGSYGYALGLSDSSADAFTLALKTLWETCTTLNLP